MTPIFVELPTIGNSVAVQLHDIRRVDPSGMGSCVKLYGKEDVYSTASVSDVVSKINRVGRAAEKAFIAKMRAMREGGY